MSNLFPTYAKWEVEPIKAYGSTIIAKDGQEYLDLTSGIGVCNLGHQPEVVKQAVYEQLNQYWHVSNLFPMEIQEQAASILASSAGLAAVFFANSGAEANEGAIKLARKATGRSKIISFTNSFHGRTFATMAATGQDKIKEGYGQMLETFVYVPFGNIEALKAELDDSVAAVMLEVIQGEGGIHVGTSEFLNAVQKLCWQSNSLLIIDEIQTGIGRTGMPFAFQHFGLKPDIVTVAKGLGSGFPIGAVMGTEALIPFFGPGSHGSTFGGNPLSLAAAIATMNTIFEPAFLQTVVEKGNWLQQTLKQELLPLPVVTDIRGLGMMVGIELTVSVGPILAELRKSHILVLPAGDKVIRLLPPLTTDEEPLQSAIHTIKNVLAKFLVTQA